MRLASQFFLAVLITTCFGANGRSQIKMDLDWKFSLYNANNLPACAPNQFPINMNSIQCHGLSQATAQSADECAKVCCNDDSCQTWQWCPPSSSTCTPAGTCWIGSLTDCTPSKDWVGQGRNNTAPVNNTKCAESWCEPNFVDNGWRSLDIPHDFVIEGTFDPNGDRSHGYLPKGIGYYRKHFSVPTQLKGKTLWLYFDGIYRSSQIYLNGNLLGTHPSGYTSHFYYVTDLVNYGAENVLAVSANAMQNEGWWYEGGGIYRHVWLYTSDQLRIVPWGIYAPSYVTGTISRGPKGPTAATARLDVETTVANDYTQGQQFSVSTRVVDAAGQTVGSALTRGSLQASGNTTVKQSISLSNVNLWDTTAPYLYTLVSSILDSNQVVVDEVTTNIGIRSAIFDKDSGFILNGQPLKIKGFCNHQDFAGVGTAVPDRINAYRVTTLQAMGANGWRMSHNPPNSELLDFTDKHGMLVWDENRNFGNDPQYFSDVAILPLRDRNHPSIVIWSLCNEGGCQENANDTGALATAQKMAAIIRSYDKTRPISGAWNSNLQDLLYGWGPKVMDLQGINYNYGEIDPYHKMYPEKPLISSETASCLGARGIYVTNNTAAHMSIFSANGCSIEWWTADATRQFMAGGFAWTGFDYKGEPTPYSWPEINSNFGTLDIAGFPKDTYWYYQSWWVDYPVLHVFPPWNPPQISDSISAEACNANDADQAFSFTGSGSNPGLIRTSGNKCVTGVCSDVSNGCSPVTLAQCNGNDQNQLFVHQTDSSFKNVQNGGCLDLWNSGQGPDVGVYTCDGASNQKWTFSGSELKSGASGNRCMSLGVPKQVWIYSNADSVELFINGKSQGVQKMPYLGNVVYNVKYEPGTIKVQGYDPSKKVIATTTTETNGSPAAIKLEVDLGGEGIFSDRQDAALIRGIVVDSQGRTVPDASNYVTFSVSGPGKIIGVGNGDPSCHEPDKASSRSAFNGLVRVVIQSTDQPGTIVVTATSPGLTSGTVSVNSVKPTQKMLYL